MLKKLVFIVLLVSCFPLNALAESHNLTISDVLEKSGFFKQVEATPKGIKIGLRRGISRGAPNADEKTRKAVSRVEDAIDKAYAKEKVFALLHQRIKNKFSQAELRELADFFDSPLGKRFTAAENKMADAKEFEKVMNNSATLTREVNKDPARVKLLQSLTEAMGGIERSVEDALSIALATHIALIHATPGKEMPPIQVLEKIHEQNRFGITGMLTQLHLASGAYVYHSFSNAELKRYLEFASSPAATKFFEEIGDALIAVNKQCGKDMGEIVADAVKQPS